MYIIGLTNGYINVVKFLADNFYLSGLKVVEHRNNKEKKILVC